MVSVPVGGTIPLSVTAHDLTPAIGGSYLPSGEWNSDAHAVWHEQGDVYPFVVGGVDSTCATSQNFWGFVLHWGIDAHAQLLLPSFSTVPGPFGDPTVRMITNSVARDIVPTPSLIDDGLMVVGHEWGSATGQTPGEPVNPCYIANTNVTCTNDDRSSAAWIEAWDDDVEVGGPDDGLPYDRVDASSAPLDLTWPSGQSAPGRPAYAANRDGEWVGMGWRTDVLPPENLCLTRAYFAWPSTATTWTSPMASVDLDVAAGFADPTDPVEDDRSRAGALSRLVSGRDRLLVGGEDLGAFPSRAVLWCGHEYTWNRSYLDELVRFDDVSEFTGLSFSYGFVDAANLSRLTFVHDMNEHGHMVVTLTWTGAATGDPGSGVVVEYPCIITLASDFNGDFRVDSRDVSLLSAAWGTSTPTYDLDGDGTVGSGDFAFLLGDYSGTALCDVHSVLPCVSEALGDLPKTESSASWTEGGDPLDVAVAALGFDDLAAFAEWCADADEEPAENAVKTIWVLWGGAG